MANRRQRERTFEELAAILGTLPEASDSFVDACRRVEDWMALYDAAYEHGCLGIVRHYAERASVPVPAAARRQADLLWFDQHVKQAHLYDAAHMALGAIASAGVRAVAIKGPLLGERLWPEFAMRTSADLDMLVAYDDLDAGMAALAGAGFVHFDTPTERYYRKSHRHLKMLHPIGAPLELHFRLFVDFGATIPAEAVLDRAVAYRTGKGLETLKLDAADELLHLVVHSVGDVSVRLSRLYDIRLLAKMGGEGLAGPGLACAALARAREFGLSRAFAMGVCDLRETGLADLTESVASVPGPPRAVTHALRRLSETTRPRPLVQSSRLFACALACESKRGAGDYIGHHLARIARRRARAYLPSLTPVEWSA